jgi:hypothetical protein
MKINFKEKIMKKLSMGIGIGIMVAFIGKYIYNEVGYCLFCRNMEKFKKEHDVEGYLKEHYDVNRWREVLPEIVDILWGDFSQKDEVIKFWTEQLEKRDINKISNN